MEERFPLWGRPSGMFDVSGSFVRSFWMAGAYPLAAAETNPAGMECTAMRNFTLVNANFRNNLS